MIMSYRKKEYYGDLPWRVRLRNKPSACCRGEPLLMQKLLAIERRTAVISDNVEEIGAFAFADCTALKYLELPKTVKLIGNNAFVNDSNLTLGVWYNSYAYQYAKENNINYTLLDGVKLGDVDGDGDITITDATAVQRYLAELDVLDDIHLYAADANGDGDVDISDATAIQMAVASIPTGYPIGEVITK